MQLAKLYKMSMCCMYCGDCGDIVLRVLCHVRWTRSGVSHIMFGRDLGILCTQMCSQHSLFVVCHFFGFFNSSVFLHAHDACDSTMRIVRVLHEAVLLIQAPAHCQDMLFHLHALYDHAGCPIALLALRTHCQAVKSGVVRVFEGMCLNMLGGILPAPLWCFMASRVATPYA